MKVYIYIYIALFSLLFLACEKEIIIDLPESERKLVVEGSIENGSFPFVFLTKSVGFFDKTDLQTLEASFIKDANVRVEVEGKTYPLDLVCANQLPQQIRELIIQSFNSPLGDLSELDFCVYLSIQLVGELGKSYQLTIDYDEKEYTSTTYIPHPVRLDSLWFIPEVEDKYGRIQFRIKDPDTLGNNYRWFAQRINKNKDGQPKDFTFITPIFSVTDDEYFNGKEFDFAATRGINYNALPDDNERFAYFTLGDTVLVKFASIDRQVYLFLRAFEAESSNSGNPFAAPSSIPSNISGGALGIWAGYGVKIETFIARP